MYELTYMYRIYLSGCIHNIALYTHCLTITYIGHTTHSIHYSINQLITTHMIYIYMYIIRIYILTHIVYSILLCMYK